jgi:hypothetical protein
MLEYENVFRRKELNDMYAMGEVKPLDDLMLIEDVALTMGEISKQISFYKEYKNKKKKDVDDAIKVLQNKTEFYKSIIISTLSHNKEKSVKFPGSCAVSSRNVAAKWSINDDEEFIIVLQEAQKAGEDVDDVLEAVTQYNIKKKEANKLLMTWEKSGKLEGFLKKAKKGIGDVVVKNPSRPTIAIRYEEVEEDTKEVEEITIPMKKSDKDYDNLEDFDTL